MPSNNDKDSNDLVKLYSGVYADTTSNQAECQQEIDVVAQALNNQIDFNPSFDKDGYVTASFTGVSSEEGKVISTYLNNNGNKLQKLVLFGALQDAKDAANKALDSYGQAAKDKIASMPGLTSDQIKEADTKIDQAVADGHANINKATDFAGVNSALADAEKSIDGVSETFQNESGKVITNQSNDNGNDVTKTHNYHKLDKIILIV
ncbi:DUF1542 domain-containing protein [Fructilactobacillus sanfranciscensis]|uniref:DUF1542 domain-containing protein n=1 Tax=Fructilactobacillus sanfranciscensis TaxID=1625 RepID=UPI000CD447B0|nr:DUF1542 domain-containing protein [Fructilactobacillus sanfranciscensis]NDR69862.1 DUF1542 domain-containing protein [Fructilactobacillus sanfranciscensis]NDS16600.1 DUF1542 domain-containing protein [Fructilactobacillus sanfranciscensis]POH19727.1 hypothetical protein BGL46_04655 [Fructilactobacillus sanfranciscensis]